MRYVYMIWMLFLFSACELGRELDIQSSDESAGYFIECYFCPGDLYNLTATKLAPISEKQLLDYSLEFQIHVIGDERIRLYHGLFSHPEKDFVYNYGSQEVAARPGNGLLRLEAVTPTGETVTGETIVPEQVVIDTAYLEGGFLNYSFDLTGDKKQDFYVASVTILDSKGERVNRYLNYYDYSDEKERKTIHVRHVIQKKVENDSINVNLKRVTGENYRYQLTLREIMSANSDNLTKPVMLEGNLTEALGIFTCYTEAVFGCKMK